MSQILKPTLLLGTSNIGKVHELEILLATASVGLRSLRDLAQAAPLVAEDGATYLENATLKAVSLARWSGMFTLADDSGLEVDALGGQPALRSARYAGELQDSEANVAKLLAALSKVAPVARTARFRCVLVVADPDGSTLSAEGICEGYITDMRRGSGGFGYDPVFMPKHESITFAEMPADQKNRISHRAVACQELSPLLLPFLCRESGVSSQSAR